LKVFIFLSPRRIEADHLRRTLENKMMNLKVIFNGIFKLQF
jgi:hypothetical protein